MEYKYHPVFCFIFLTFYLKDLVLLIGWVMHTYFSLLCCILNCIPTPFCISIPGLDPWFICNFFGCLRGSEEHPLHSLLEPCLGRALGPVQEY